MSLLYIYSISFVFRYVLYLLTNLVNQFHQRNVPLLIFPIAWATLIYVLYLFKTNFVLIYFH